MHLPNHDHNVLLVDKSSKVSGNSSSFSDHNNIKSDGSFPDHDNDVLLMDKSFEVSNNSDSFSDHNNMESGGSFPNHDNDVPLVDNSSKVSGNSSAFSDHNDTESGGSSHMDINQNSTKECMKRSIEDNNASDVVTPPHKRAKLK
jgi:hypothetical protein